MKQTQQPPTKTQNGVEREKQQTEFKAMKGHILHNQHLSH